MEPYGTGPALLRQANLSHIRQAIKARSAATRAEIVSDTHISSTTVRALLSELMQAGEVKSIGHDQSSGGRKPERYALTPDRYFGAAFCLTGNELHGLLVDLRGEIIEQEELPLRAEGLEQTIAAHLDRLQARHELRSIGIGVPGVVEGSGFWRQDAQNGTFHKLELGASLSARYGLPILLENDLNATAIGFGRCYKHMFPQVVTEEIHMAYLYFEKNCISAGLITGGRIIRGHQNFAGELGQIPLPDGRLLHEWLADPMEDLAYIRLVISVVSWVCGILNPQYVVLGGPAFRMDCAGPIGDGLSAMLPAQMFAEILTSKDVWCDYHEGMAYLTAQRMFETVRFTKE